MVDSSSKTKGMPNSNWVNFDAAQNKLLSLLEEIIEHPGFGELHVNIRILKDARKEVVLCYGKEYRFVLTQANNEITKEPKN
jgi:hypothetical protein